MTPARILLSGDLHMGRTSTRLSPDLPRETGTTTAAWQRLVDLAIRQEVELLCLCGDIVDAENRFWEAAGPLESGIQKLASHGITTLAIAGNHDHDVLPRLVDVLDSPWLILLGRNGSWQRYLHYRQEELRLALDGWSFPQAHVDQDPVAYYQPRDPHVPVLVLLHGELDATGSVHAPLSRSRMQGLPVDGWILGHNHNPPGQRQEQGAPPVLYVGTPQALDPSEYGFHGPWLAEVGPRGIQQLHQLPLSDVRYETCLVDLTGLSPEESLESAIMSRIDRLAREVAAESGQELDYLCLRLELTGQTDLAPWIREFVSDPSRMQRQTEHFLVAIEQMEVTATLPIDLNEYAASNTPPGVLARLLLELDSRDPSPETRQLLSRVRAKLEEVSGRTDCSLVPEQGELGEETARHYLRLEARNLLNYLLRQSS